MTRLTRRSIYSRRLLAALLTATAVVLSVAGAHADEKAIADFYSSRTVTIAVGFSAGGNYDLYARLIARHIGRHVPGHPNIIVQNMPGAGSRVLANARFNLGPHDGTMIGLPNQALVTDQVTGVDGVQFDARQFQWVGSPYNDVQVAWSWHTSRAKTFELAKQYEVVVATSGPGSVTYFYPKVMNALLGTRFKLVSGYPGATEMDLATERGEVDGRGAEAWSAVKRKGDWVATGKVNLLVQFGLRKAPDLPNVPMLPDLAGNAKDRQVLEFLSLTPAMGRPFFLPPKVSAERVAVIRKAFDETMKDPVFLQDAERSRLDVNPVAGEELQRIVEKALATPKDVIAAFNKALE